MRTPPNERLKRPTSPSRFSQNTSGAMRRCISQGIMPRVTCSCGWRSTRWLGCCPRCGGQGNRGAAPGLRGEPRRVWNRLIPRAISGALLMRAFIGCRLSPSEISVPSGSKLALDPHLGDRLGAVTAQRQDRARSARIEEQARFRDASPRCFTLPNS